MDFSNFSFGDGKEVKNKEVVNEEENIDIVNIPSEIFPNNGEIKPQKRTLNNFIEEVATEEKEEIDESNKEVDTEEETNIVINMKDTEEYNKNDCGIADVIPLFEEESHKESKKTSRGSAEDEYYESDANDGLLGDTILSDILSGVNGGAFDYDFKEADEKDLSDGSEVGFKGTIINRSHEFTSLRKSGAIGVRAETEASKKLRESYIYEVKEDGTPIYNFNEGGKILDFEEISNSEVVLKKDTKHMGTLYFKECTKEEARDMIICGHYSHKFQGYFGKVNVGVYTEGRLVGVASFGGLMNPKSFKNFGDFKENEVLELNRLWVDDELGMNTETMLLSASWKIMRLKYPEIKIVQSFADGRLGAGTIYKASNFKYYGCESTLFFQDKETGVIYHKVGIENTKAPTSFMRLNKKYCEGKLQQFRVNTYRYIFALYDYIEKPVKDKEGNIIQEVSKRAKRDSLGNVIRENGKPVLEEYYVDKVEKVPLKIAFKEQEYPEYQRGQNMLEDYEHPISLICRAYTLARFLKYKEDGVDYIKFFEDYLNSTDKNRDKELKYRDWYNEVKLSMRNNTIKDMVKYAEEELKKLQKDGKNISEEDIGYVAKEYEKMEVEFVNVDPKKYIKKDNSVSKRLSLL